MILSDIGSAFLGGIVIGLAVLLLMAGLGRIAGISGILSGLLAGINRRRKSPASGAAASASASAPADFSWRLLFLIGLMLGAWGMARSLEGPAPIIDIGWAGLAFAGLLVGFGTGLGQGCTSGHGICGLARLSPRSLVATAIFMATAMATIFIRRHLLG